VSSRLCEMRKLRILRLSQDVAGSAAGVRSNTFTVRDGWSAVYGPLLSAFPPVIRGLGVSRSTYGSVSYG